MAKAFKHRYTQSVARKGSIATTSQQRPKAKKRLKVEHLEDTAKARLLAQKRREGIHVEPEKLARHNSYGPPRFVVDGFYSDAKFTCAACGEIETWTARQQKWWYEVAQGSIYSSPKLCRPCRRREQARRDEQRRRSEEGLKRKKARRKLP